MFVPRHNHSGPTDLPDQLSSQKPSLLKARELGGIPVLRCAPYTDDTQCPIHLRPEGDDYFGLVHPPIERGAGPTKVNPLASIHRSSPKLPPHEYLPDILNGLQIRLGYVADIAAVQRLVVSAVNVACQSSLYTPDERSWWRNLVSGERGMLDLHETLQTMDAYVVTTAPVSSEAASIVGFLALGHPKGGILSLYVAPEYQGLGIGKSLVNVASNAFRAEGRHQLYLDSALSAVSFYEKLGFLKSRFTPLKRSDGLGRSVRYWPMMLPLSPVVPEQRTPECPRNQPRAET